MKTRIVLLALLLGIGMACRAQDTTQGALTEHALDSMSLVLIQKFGDKKYYEICRELKPSIAQKTFDMGGEHNGRLYYAVTFGEPKKVKFEFGFTAEVFFWTDGEPYMLHFGSGQGFINVASLLENEKKGTPITPVRFAPLEDKR